METLWFILVALMLTAYVVLDGFDLGAGIINLFVAKNHDERRLVLRAIGPVWDGNEVWLLAAGGRTLLCFPLTLRLQLQWFLSAIDDRAVVINAARHWRRVEIAC